MFPTGQGPILRRIASRPCAWTFALAFVATVALISDAAFAQPGNTTTPADKAPQGVRGARYPSLSADGEYLTFTYGGDIWVMPAQGGAARRITQHEAYDVCSRISPDGTTIAFTSNRGGGYDIYTVPFSGGIPERLTQDYGGDYLADWVDDDTLLMASVRDAEFRIYTVPTDFTTPTRLTRFAGMDPALSPDGRWLFVVEGATDPLQRRYSGSANWDIWRIDLEESERMPQRVTQTSNNEFDPIVTADGKWIYFRAEVNGVYNLYRLPTNAGPEIQAEQVTTFSGGGLMDAVNYSAANNTITFEYDFYLYWLNLDVEGATPEPFTIHIVEDERGDDTQTATVTSGASNADVSPDGNWIAFELNGDIWIMPSGGGEAQRVIGGPGAQEWPRFSPNGRYIAYQMATEGSYDIYAFDSQTRQTIQITNHPANEHFFDWAPDGSAIVFCSDRDGDKDIWLQQVNGGVDAIQLTDAPGPDDDPTFTADGKQIVFDSGRTGSQDIYVMNVDGSGVRQITANGAFNQVATVSPDGRFVVYESYAELAPGVQPSLMVVSINGGTTMLVVANARAPQYSPSGAELIYTSIGARGEEGLARLPAPKEIVSGSAIPVFAQMQSSRRESQAALFDEAWTAINNAFYDATFHGTDWEGVKRHYRSLVVASSTREEVVLLLNKMVGELAASHQGVYGSTAYSAARGANGQLGAELEVVKTERGMAMKIVSIMSGGPADRAWLRPGDHIFGVNGQRLVAGVNWYALMRDTVGETVQLLVSPGLDYAAGRQIVVTPVDNGALRQMKHQQWLANNARVTRDMSKGRIAYTHIPAMNQQSLAQFSQFITMIYDRADGLVIDIRGNGGGNIHRQLMDILFRQRFAYTTFRMQQKFFQPDVCWDKPVTIIIDKHSFSDAEVFPCIFQAVGRGKVVGEATSGSVIGTNDVTLSDGATRIRLTSTGYFLTDGDVNMEGTGCTPDIAVDLTWEDLESERDPQLEAAIQQVLAELEAGTGTGNGSGTGNSGEGGTGSSGNGSRDDSDEEGQAMPPPSNNPDPLPYEWLNWYVPVG